MPATAEEALAHPGQTKIKRYRITGFKSDFSAQYSAKHRMIYLPCKLELGADDPPRSHVNQQNNPDIVMVPLASFLHTKNARKYLIEEIFYRKTQKPLSRSVLGPFDLNTRDLISPIAPNEVAEPPEDVSQAEVWTSTANLSRGVYAHSKTPSWAVFDPYFNHAPLF